VQVHDRAVSPRAFWDEPLAGTSRNVDSGNGNVVRQYRLAREGLELGTAGLDAESGLGSVLPQQAA
jgi:hypothetical protein